MRITWKQTFLVRFAGNIWCIFWGTTLQGNPKKLVSTGLGFCLVPSGIKQLPKPVLTKIYGAIWRHHGPGLLTHCGLVTPYGGRDLCQHWFR